MSESVSEWRRQQQGDEPSHQTTELVVSRANFTRPQPSWRSNLPFAVSSLTARCARRLRRLQQVSLPPAV